MSNWYFYPYKDLTGGGDGALDSLDGSILKDGDAAFVVIASTGAFYVYYLDEDSGAAENSPLVISPDANAGDKRWVRAVSSIVTDATGVTYTATGTGAAARTLQSKLSGYVDVKDFGAVGNGTADDTAAIQAAVDAAASVYFPPGIYKVTATIDVDTNNRFHLFGVGMATRIDFSPAADSDTMFTVSNNMDNGWFDNLYLYFQNSASKHSAGAVDITDSCNSINFRNVRVEAFDEFGIRHDEAMYDKFIDCQFINMDNKTQNDHVAKALFFDTYGNSITITGCRFANNDMAIHAEDGIKISVRDCTFELNGDSGEAHITSIVHMEGVDGFTFQSNYVEGNTTPSTYGVVRCDGCVAPIISGNTFYGDSGGTTYTSIFVTFDASCVRPLVQNNLFSEILEYFIRTSVFVRLFGNKFVDGAAEKTAYNDIMALISGNDVVELDVDYTFAWNPADIANNAGDSSGQSITGVRYGDRLTLSCANNAGALLPYVYIDSANNAVARLYNPGTGGNINVGNETFRIQVNKGK